MHLLCMISFSPLWNISYNQHYDISLVTQPMMLRWNCTELRSMDSYIQILCRFKKSMQKVPPSSLLCIKNSDRPKQWFTVLPEPNRTSQSKFCFPNRNRTEPNMSKVHKNLDLNSRLKKQTKNFKFNFKLIWLCWHFFFAFLPKNQWLHFVLMGY